MIKEEDGGGEVDEGGGSWRFTHHLSFGLLPHGAYKAQRTRVRTPSRAAPAPRAPGPGLRGAGGEEAGTVDDNGNTTRSSWPLPQNFQACEEMAGCIRADGRHH